MTDPQPPAPVPGEPDTAAMGSGEGNWRKRALAAEGKLAALRAVLLEGGQDDGTVRRRALAVIGSEEGAGRG
jgi:hypothetical protein